MPVPSTVEHQAEGVSLRLVGTLRAGDARTLIQDPGWVEYLFAVDNRDDRHLMIYNVKLLNRDGRYLDSAESYEQVTYPPDVATDVAGSLAKGAAGIAAGQVIPYGGTIFGIISGAVSASSVESEADAKREFELRKLKLVELAPGGRVIGSAFLPDVVNAESLVIDYGYGGARERVEIPLSRS